MSLEWNETLPLMLSARIPSTSVCVIGDTGAEERYSALVSARWFLENRGGRWPAPQFDASRFRGAIVCQSSDHDERSHNTSEMVRAAPRILCFDDGGAFRSIGSGVVWVLTLALRLGNCSFPARMATFSHCDSNAIRGRTRFRLEKRVRISRGRSRREDLQGAVCLARAGQVGDGAWRSAASAVVRRPRHSFA